MKPRAGALLALTLAAAGGLVGCGHTEVHEVVLRPTQGPSHRAVELYFEGRRPPRPVYEVGLLQAIGFGDEANAEDVSHALARRASELGCEAVVRLRIDQGYSRAHAYGVCVRYSPVAHRGAPAPPPPSAPIAPPAPPPDATDGNEP